MDAGTWRTGPLTLLKIPESCFSLLTGPKFRGLTSRSGSRIILVLLQYAKPEAKQHGEERVVDLGNVAGNARLQHLDSG